MILENQKINHQIFNAWLSSLYPENRTFQYKYDPFGRRIEKKVVDLEFMISILFRI